MVIAKSKKEEKEMIYKSSLLELVRLGWTLVSSHER
jgi:hypothetical protein